MTLNGRVAYTAPNCPDCGERAICPTCGKDATYQTPFDKVFWCSKAHWWRCKCQGKKD